RNALLESEKRRFERSYVNLEREYSALKSSLKSSTLFHHPTTRRLSPPSPPPPPAANRFEGGGDQCSLLSLTQLLDSNFLAPSTTIRSLETLRQTNDELQQRVLLRSTITNSASNRTDDRFDRKATVRMQPIISHSNGEDSDDPADDDHHHRLVDDNQNLL